VPLQLALLLTGQHVPRAGAPAGRVGWNHHSNLRRGTIGYADEWCCERITGEKQSRSSSVAS
jgi:hypothetical protein